MITKRELRDLYVWGVTSVINNTFEKKADKYIGRYRDFGTYMVTGNWLKMSRKLTTIRKSAMPDHIYKIHQNPEILYSGYANLKPGYHIQPHKAPDVSMQTTCFP